MLHERFHIKEGVRAGLRAAVTTGDYWSLILAPEESEKEAGKAEVTFIVDGVPRALKPFGGVDTELYNIKLDPKQERDLLSAEPEAAGNIYDAFLKLLSDLGAPREIIAPWLKREGLER